MMTTLILATALFLAPPEGGPHRMTLEEAVPLVFDEDHGDWDGSRPDCHAPIGVMGEHIHAAGEFMLSYRYMHMFMKGNRDGTSSMSNAEVYAQGFMIAPTEMTMAMHMFGFMAAPTDDVTLMFMVNYVDVEMDHRMMAGTTFTTRAEGLGDSRVTALCKLYQRQGHHLHANIGVSLPTGSINEEDTTPMGPNQQLPYPMQLGSGTLDPILGATYLGQTEGWSWGAQVIGTFRLGRNQNEYSQGERLDVSAWGAKTLGRWFSASLRLNWGWWGNFDGSDEELAVPPTMVPTADPGRRAGTRLDALVGLNFYVREGFLTGHRLAIEFGLPLFQDLDGPQLETDWLATIGWQWAF